MMRHFKTHFYIIIFISVGVHCTLFALNKHISHDWSQPVPHKLLGNRPLLSQYEYRLHQRAHLGLKEKLRSTVGIRKLELLATDKLN